MPRQASTNPNKVNAFATKVDKDPADSSKKLNTCTGIIKWNNANGERQETKVQYGVINNKLVALSSEDLTPNPSAAPSLSPDHLNKVTDLWDQYMDAKNRRVKSSDLLQEFSEEMEDLSALIAAMRTPNPQGEPDHQENPDSSENNESLSSEDSSENFEESSDEEDTEEMEDSSEENMDDEDTEEDTLWYEDEDDEDDGF